MWKTSEKAESGIDDYKFRSQCKKKNPNTRRMVVVWTEIEKKKKKIEMKIEDKVLQTCCFWGPDGIFESECPTDRW